MRRVWLSAIGGWAELSAAERIPVASNAEAARLASETQSAAAIAGRAAADYYGLNILAANIEDEPNNTTRFVVFSRQDVAPSGLDKTSLVMSIRNRPGAIHELLAPLAQNRREHDPPRIQPLPYRLVGVRLFCRCRRPSAR